ncbi:MAG: DUF1573 domain-containing protein [Thermoguttaceae bacterium]|nr:DUF1573 domain-containing protein [Thermoguttaceae bacterium]MDW8039759.1 DUF1573 domain-containing protein [Thermoguttaceae bacterium]
MQSMVVCRAYEAYQRAIGRVLTGGAMWILAFCLPPLALAQDWAKRMFDHTSADLGTVARGAKIEHIFTIENIYVEDVHIASIRTTCGCTIPSIEKKLLKTYEKVPLRIELDTKNFSGRKDVTITVQFDQPFPAEVSLYVSVFIRTDVVFNPGSVQFGSVPQGKPAEQKLSVVYAGRPDWRILRVESPKPYLEARLKEVARLLDPTLGATRVTYDLWVRLKPEAPAGRILEYLLLTTDDPNPKSAQIPLVVEGTVVPPLAVSPSPLNMGPVPAGSTVTKPLVLQARQPFRILAVEADPPEFLASPPQAAKPVHVLPIQFTAGQQTGKVSGRIRIQTDLADSPWVEVPVEALIVPGP